MSQARQTTRRRTRSRAQEAQVSVVKESNKTIELARELGYAYREYAHYTLLDRAIADVRDGFKPVHRLRIRNSHRTTSPFKAVGKILVANALASIYWACRKP